MSFSFTPKDVGLSAGRSTEETSSAAAKNHRVTMETYEDYCGIRSMSLFDAVAVSGAALSPLMGRLTRPGLRIFFTIVNIRLGVWLPSPSRVKRHGRAAMRWPGPRARRPGAKALLREMTGLCGCGKRWLYVTDGGDLDNLGLLEALRRRPSEVIVIDASADHVGSWSVLGEAIALARADLGAEITLDQPPADLPKGRAYLHGRVHYADNTEAQLWVAKAVRGNSADLPWDVYAYQTAHRHFPDDSTAQQLYGETEFEAYRGLGHCIVKQVLTARAAAAKEAAESTEITVPEIAAPLLAADDDLARLASLLRLAAAAVHPGDG
jgi:hypothetical protein